MPLRRVAVAETNSRKRKLIVKRRNGEACRRDLLRPRRQSAGRKAIVKYRWEEISGEKRIFWFSGWKEQGIRIRIIEFDSNWEEKDVRRRKIDFLKGIILSFFSSFCSSWEDCLPWRESEIFFGFCAGFCKYKLRDSLRRRLRLGLWNGIISVKMYSREGASFLISDRKMKRITSLDKKRSLTQMICRIIRKEANCNLCAEKKI